MSGFKKLAASNAAVVQKKKWTVVKFCMLFAVVAGFVSYNFGVIIGLSVAVAITVLSIANWKVFDIASDAFFDVNDSDDVEDETQKVAATIAKRIFFTILSYGLAVLSILFVVVAKKVSLPYLATIVVMWLVIDIPSAAVSVWIYERKGIDITLGRSYRRMVNAILKQSRVAGIIAMTYEATMSSFWSGPDYSVIFFKDELGTKMRMVIALVAITAVHAVLWTTVYWFGYDNITEFIRFILKG